MSNFYTYSSDRKTQPELFLCKPDKTIVGILSEAYGIEHSAKLGGLNELTFNLPFKIEVDHQLIDNPNIELLLYRYLIKFYIEDQNYTEWFLLEPSEKTMTSDEDEISIKAYSLAYELNDKIIRGYSKGVPTDDPDNPPVNATTVLTDILVDTLWSLGYINADFDLMYRSFEFDSQKVANCISDIVETFGGITTYDTELRQISLYKPEQIGSYHGLNFDYGKYLKELKQNLNIENFCTRLKIYGMNETTIHSVNPTGLGYIENFSYFIDQYAEDLGGNVISHSRYMSDSLCHAWIIYQELIELTAPTFNTLLNTLNNYQEQLTQLENDLTILQNELIVLQDTIDVKQAGGQDASSELAQAASKQNEINAKELEITAMELNITNTNNSITALKNSLSLANNLTTQQIQELNQFIIEKEVTNEYISDPSILKTWAEAEFYKYYEPQVEVEIEAIDLAQFLDMECQYDKNNLVLGEIINLYHTMFNINISAKIVEISHNYEDASVNLVISNIDTILRDRDTFLKMLNEFTTTSLAVEMSKYKWDGYEDSLNNVSVILNNAWEAARESIIAGVNESVVIDRRGITITDPTDPLKFIRITHGVMGITTDGGNTYHQVIDGSGVYAERLVGQIILGNQLFIEDESGEFNITGNLLTVKDADNNIRVKLGEYASGKYGLELRDATGEQVIIDETGLLQTWQEGRTDNLGIGADYGLELNVYVPSETVEVYKTKLRFKRLKFRAYETGAASGGGPISTTSSSGTTSTSAVAQTSGGPSIGIGGGPLQSGGPSATSSVSTSSAGNHDHGIYSGDKVAIGMPVTSTRNWSLNGSHSHTVSIPSTTHTHNILGAVQTTLNIISGHTHTVPSHSHTVYDHSHLFTPPQHTHSIIYGIYEGPLGSSIQVIVNGSVVGTYSSDQDSLDIKSYMMVGAWNTIKLISTSTLGRVDATIFIQAKIGV